MYSREELLGAVREVGRNGQSFTLAAVRARLGLKPGDKSALGRFNALFRSAQRTLGDELEKLGNGQYRLTSCAEPEPAPPEPLLDPAPSTAPVSERFVHESPAVVTATALTLEPAIASESAAPGALRQRGQWLYRCLQPFARRTRRLQLRVSTTSMQTLLQRLRTSSAVVCDLCSSQFSALRTRVAGLRGPAA